MALDNAAISDKPRVGCMCDHSVFRLVLHDKFYLKRSYKSLHAYALRLTVTRVLWLQLT